MKGLYRGLQDILLLIYLCQFLLFYINGRIKFRSIFHNNILSIFLIRFLYLL
jgi:hypothetical protein